MIQVIKLLTNQKRFGEGLLMTRQFKIVVEKHPDGYVAYPLGLKGIVVGEGNTYEEALADVKSAIAFHIETFGVEVLEGEEPVLEAFIAEAGVTV
jgi:predicted RNase H-like HicB family nuclease